MPVVRLNNAIGRRRVVRSLLISVKRTTIEQRKNNTLLPFDFPCENDDVNDRMLSLDWSFFTLVLLCILRMGPYDQ